MCSCESLLFFLPCLSSRLAPPGLRQDYASTSSVMANRRSQSFTFQLSQLGAGPHPEEEDEEEDDEDYGLLPPPQPRLTRLPHSHTFSSVRDWRRSAGSLCTPPSTPSTPPYPSAGFAFPAQLQELGSLRGAEQQGFRPGSGERNHLCLLHGSKTHKEALGFQRLEHVSSFVVDCSIVCIKGEQENNTLTFNSQRSSFVRRP